MANDKRKANSQGDVSNVNKKVKKQWQTPKKSFDGKSSGLAYKTSIEAGDAGIWATCVLGKEARCVGELRDLLNEHVEGLRSEDAPDADVNNNSQGDKEVDIEAQIENELEEIRKPVTQPLVTHIRVDVPCVIFFKTSPPIEPVSAVHAICTAASTNTTQKRSRFLKRLTPMTLIGKATESGLDSVAQQVLAPHFHEPNSGSKKFAIRPSFRNHNVLKRDMVIKKIADIVGPGHKVDLKAYDLLILVEIHQNVCGMSVVGADYDRLKRYNLAEIYEPTPEGKESV